MSARRGIVALIGLTAAGCIPRETRSIGATDTLANIPAIQDAARGNDRKSIPALIKQLESDDGAVRFYAITALYKLTNQTLGYRYYDDSDDRQPAVERWKKWLAAQPPLPNKQ